MSIIAAGIWLLAPVLALPTSEERLVITPSLTRFSFEETHMGSVFKILLYSTDEATARRASRAAFDRIAALNRVLSDYDPDSELSRFCLKAGGPPVKISQDFLDVLDRSLAIYHQSGGAFDITIAPVGRLWRRARRERKLPDPELLAKARALVGSQHLEVDRVHQTARLGKAGMRIDVGGIAKGYASQAAIDVLKACGVPIALVAGAGDIVAGDAPPDLPGWKIAIAALEPNAPPTPTLLIKNAAVSTSGDAERYVIIDGHRYSHIINPVTGVGVEDRASVTVVAPDGGTADALETTVYILGPERGLKLVDETPGTAAIFFRSTPYGIKTYESSRFKDVPRFIGRTR